MNRIQGMLAIAGVGFVVASSAIPADRNRALIGRIIRGAKTDGQRACKLFEAAEGLQGDPQLLRKLLETCYEYGLRAKREDAGYYAAEKATILLAAKGLAQAEACRNKLRELYKSRCRQDSAVSFHAAWKVLALHVEDGDRAAEASRWSEALKWYKQAAAVARTKRLEVGLEMQAKILSVEHRLAVQKRCTNLERRAREKGDTPPLREALVRLYVVELDDAAGAEKRLTGVCGEEMRTYVPLAAQEADKVAAPAHLELAKWYSSMSAKAKRIGEAVCLLRAKEHYEQFLTRHTGQDRARLEAQTGLAKAKEALAKAQPLDLAAAWLLGGRDWGSFIAWSRHVLSASVGPQPLDHEVLEAVKRGRAYLFSQQQVDGSWPGRGETAVGKGYPVGPSALAVCALLQSGLPAADPRMIKAMDWLAKKSTKKTYSLALRCNVWMLTEQQLPGRYRGNLLRDARLLMRSTRDGSYGYDCLGKGKGSGCNSNSQFGLWGVYCAAKAGVRVPRGYWPFVLRRWQLCQKADGGWEYKPNAGVTATMTAAGLASVSACLDRMSRAPQHLPAAGKAVDWLEKYFAAMVAEGKFQGHGDLYYFLYALARAQTVRGKNRLGKIDWYELGKQALLAKQAKDGSWNARHGKLVATAFAVMFLTQGRKVRSVQSLDAVPG